MPIARFSSEALTEGIEERRAEGVTLRVYAAAKTVAHCFKYRNKIGIDLAVEALREYRRTHPKQLDAIRRFAEVCRIRTVIGPYLEALSA